MTRQSTSLYSSMLFMRGNSFMEQPWLRALASQRQAPTMAPRPSPGPLVHSVSMRRFLCIAPPPQPPLPGRATGARGLQMAAADHVDEGLAAFLWERREVVVQITDSFEVHIEFERTGFAPEPFTG